jgi:hypothetical protein
MLRTEADPDEFWRAVAHAPGAPAEDVGFAGGLPAPADPAEEPAAAPPPPLNLGWLCHLAGAPSPPGAPGTAADDREPLLRALCAALPELALYAEPLIAARGVPPEAFVGARARRRPALRRCGSSLTRGVRL